MPTLERTYTARQAIARITGDADASSGDARYARYWRLSLALRGRVGSGNDVGWTESEVRVARAAYLLLEDSGEGLAPLECVQLSTPAAGWTEGQVLVVDVLARRSQLVDWEAVPALLAVPLGQSRVLRVVRLS